MRRGISELLGSVLTLSMTVALLSGVLVYSSSAISSATSSAVKRNSEIRDQIGIIVSVVYSSENSSGSYVYLYNLGWVGAPIQGVSINGNQVSYGSSCKTVSPGSLCVIKLSPGIHGVLTAVVGGKEIEFTV